ncbi:MAG: type IV secretion system protein [Pontixanthobacter sp.]
MACPAIITGDQFLLRVIDHIDCQAQIMGSYGYQSLGQPGSFAAIVASSLLTLFVALFGIRLLLGPAPGARDTVVDILKIGIVLTLAFSWPAFRTVIHDVVLDGPAQIANSVIPPSLSSSSLRFAQRLQSADRAMVKFTEQGTGRDTGAFLEGSQSGAGFAGTALQDDAALGYGRLAYLAGTISAVGLLRLIGALLLALAPLAAGLLLFEQTRGIFSGWLRGLTLALIGSVGATAVLALELSILEPWLADALRVRAMGYAIPSAPIEMFAITLSFATIQFAMIWLLAKIAFNRGWPNLPEFPSQTHSAVPGLANDAPAAWVVVTNRSRAERISDHVETLVRREQAPGSRVQSYSDRLFADRGNPDTPTLPSREAAVQTPRLGSSYRRTAARSSQAGTIRDATR